jgi:putative membrane protein
MADLYVWMRALHVISIIAWMAGLLYLPRLYVYHTAVPAKSAASETFKVMEMKLLRFIMNPAMVASFITGGLLIWILSPEVLREGWLHAKLLLLALMAGMHGMMAKWRRDFALDRNVRSGRFYRWMNEVPTVLMIGIVILVIVKPF